MTSGVIRRVSPSVGETFLCSSLSVCDLGGLLCCARSSYRWTLRESTRRLMRLCGLQISDFSPPSTWEKYETHADDSDVSILRYMTDLVGFNPLVLTTWSCYYPNVKKWFLKWLIYINTWMLFFSGYSGIKIHKIIKQFIPYWAKEVKKCIQYGAFFLTIILKIKHPSWACCVF